MPAQFLRSSELLREQGLFETLVVKNGRPEFFDDHWERMRASAEALGIVLKAEKEEVLQLLPRRDGAVRLTCGQSGFFIQEWTPPARPEAWILVPIGVEPDPMAAHKRTEREPYEAWHRIAVSQGGTDALLVTAEKFLLETTRANIFLL